MEYDISQLVRVFLGAYFTFIAIFYSLKLLLNKTGQQLSRIGDVGTAHWLGHITFRVFRLLIWGVCVARIFYHDIDLYLGVVEIWNGVLINLLGALLLVVSFGVIYLAHQALKDSWRLGIDPHGPEILVTHNIYSKTRNPIFIGVLIGQFGFFLALPSVFSLVCFLLGSAAIFKQIKLEEAYLQQHIPRQYADYSRRVPRWLW